MNRKKMGQNLIVLLIDDDREDQWIFTMLVREISSSINCVVADSGAEALAKLNHNQSFIPHFIFIDMNMPHMDGIECLTGIKKISRLIHTPVYMYSSSADPHFVSNCKTAGAVDVIQKEADVETLKSIISRIFQQQNANVI